MSDLQVIVTLLVFAGVILLIAFNVLHLVLAAMLGVSIMLLFGVFTREEFLHAAQTAGGSISLLFGGMVVARTLVPTPTPSSTWPNRPAPALPRQASSTILGNAHRSSENCHTTSAQRKDSALPRVLRRLSLDIQWMTSRK